MELCQLLENESQRKTEIQRDLKQNLLSLHSAKIIHHDIKVQNVCFSPFFARFVFVDFGLSKVIKENIGFKSRTGFRGSLYYCSEQMVQLFYLEGKADKQIDLYFNDLVGLKVILQDLNQQYFQQIQINDTSLQIIGNAKDRFDNLNSLHQLYFIKHCLFEENYHLLDMSKLERQFDMSNFLSNSNKVNNRQKQLKTLLKNSLKDKLLIALGSQRIQEQPYQITTKVWVANQINKINKPSPLHYFLNQFSKNINQLFVLLQNKETAAKLSLQDHLCLLSKAIQTNATAFKLKQLDQICLIAFERCRELQWIDEVQQIYKQRQTKYFCQMSIFLLKRSLQNNLKGSYFTIFKSTLLNVCLFELVSNCCLLQLYESLLQMQLGFQKKLESLLTFHQTFRWIKNTNVILDKKQLLENIKQKSLCFLNKDVNFNDSYDQHQLRLLKIVLLNDQFELECEAYCQNWLISKQMTARLKLWSKYTSNQKYQSLRIDFNDLESQIQFESNNFQYFHFSLLGIFTITRESRKLAVLIQKGKNSLKDKKSNLLILVEKIFQFNKTQNYKEIKSLIEFLEKIQNKNHIMNCIIQQELTQIINIYPTKIETFGFQLKNRIFSLHLQTALNRLQRKKSILKKSIKQRYFDLFCKFSTQKNLQINYSNFQGILTEDCYSKYKQIYLNLKKQRLYASHQSSSLNDENQALFQSNLTLLIFFIQKKKYNEAITIVSYLNRVISFFSDSQLKKYFILQFINRLYWFPSIIRKNSKDKLNFQCLEYLQLIEENQEQEKFIVKPLIFLTFFNFAYQHYQPKKLAVLISKTSKKLEFYNYKFMMEKWINILELFFVKNGANPIFQAKNQQLQKLLTINIRDNPYNIIYLFFIYKKKIPIIKQHFITVFQEIKSIHVVLREYIFRLIYFGFVASNYQSIKQRKRMALNKMILKYSLFKVTVSMLLKCYVPKKSLVQLKKSINQEKKQKLRFILLSYTENLEWLKEKLSQNLRLQYSKIQVY